MKVYYEESYGRYYEVDATNNHEAEKKLIQLIGEGKENSPDECKNSVVCALIGNGKPDFQIMGAKIETLSDDEKEFYLWHLLRFYYAKKLIADKKKYENDHAVVDQIDRLERNVAEIDTLLCYDMF